MKHPGVTQKTRYRLLTMSDPDAVGIMAARNGIDGVVVVSTFHGHRCLYALTFPTCSKYVDGEFQVRFTTHSFEFLNLIVMGSHGVLVVILTGYVRGLPQ